MNLERYSTLFLFLILICGFILRFYSIETNGLWIDEIWSMQASSAKQSITEVILTALNDTHPPLFDIILHYALIITNNYEFTGRYLALLFGMMGLLFTYSYSLKLSNSKSIALLALSIISFNYWHVIYSFEGRFYTLLYLLALPSILELYYYILESKKSYLIKFILSAILICYTHYYGAILIFCLAIICSILLVLKLIPFQKFKNIILAFLIVLIAFSPCLPYMFSNSKVVSWMSKPQLADFLNYYYLYTGKNPLEFILLFIPLLFGWKLIKNKTLLAFFYGTIILGFMVPYIVSQVSTPLLHKRYTFIYLPSIYLMTALFWPQLKLMNNKWKTFIYLVIVISIPLNFIFLRKDFKDGSKDQWKEVGQFIADKNIPTVFTEHHNYLDYYSNKNILHINTIKNYRGGVFWLLLTNYDSKDITQFYSLEVLEEHLFLKEFRLVKVKFI